MKKTSIYFMALILLMAGMSFLVAKSPLPWIGARIIHPALAEDDDEEDHDEEDDDRTDSLESSASKPKTITTWTKLPDQIIKKLITTTIYDSDGDGIFDPDDSTPNIHNVFMVQDANANGIDDSYEGQ